MSKPNRQKAHESSFPTILLTDGNVVKFLHTNRKHFTVGDRITFTIVKWRTKTPKTSLLLVWRGPPYNTAIPRPTARTTPNRSSDGWDTVARRRRKSPLFTMARPKFAPKSTPSCGSIRKPHYLPYPWTRPTYDAKRHTDPMRRFSTMHWTDARRPTNVRTHWQTDRPTDRQIVHGKVWRL